MEPCNFQAILIKPQNALNYFKHKSQGTHFLSGI